MGSSHSSTSGPPAQGGALAAPSAPATTFPYGVIQAPVPVQTAPQVECFLHPGQACLKAWKCKWRSPGSKTKRRGDLHVFATSLCFHPTGSRRASATITQIDLAAIEDVGLNSGGSKALIYLLTPMGRTYISGMPDPAMQECYLSLSSLCAQARSCFPLVATTTTTTTMSRSSSMSTLPSRQQPSPTLGLRMSNEDVARQREMARLESEFGMRAHTELPEAMAALFLRARQSMDLLLAHGLTPNAPTMVNKTDTILPVSLSSFWRAFASARWHDWPHIFLPAGRWRAKVGEWKTDSIGISRQVVFTAKAAGKGRALEHDSEGTVEDVEGQEQTVEVISSVQLACLVVDRRNFEPRIHVAVISTINGDEWPKAKEWFELVDISRDKGFPLLQVLDYRWHEQAPTPLV